MNARRLTMTVSIVAAMTFHHNTADGGTLLFISNPTQTNHSPNSSPNASMQGNIFVHNFQSGLIRTPGLTARNGNVGTTAGLLSSQADAAGNDSSSQASGLQNLARLANARRSSSSGNADSAADLLWAKQSTSPSDTFRTRDEGGLLISQWIAQMRATVNRSNSSDAASGDDNNNGFFGVAPNPVITNVPIQTSPTRVEKNTPAQPTHGGSYAVVPVPAPVGIGLAGLLGAAFLRHRTQAISAATKGSGTGHG